jgi:hypothetical protein
MRRVECNLAEPGFDHQPRGGCKVGGGWYGWLVGWLVGYEIQVLALLVLLLRNMVIKTITFRVSVQGLGSYTCDYQICSACAE